MARTKQTARVKGKGPRFASKAAQKKGRKGKAMHILKRTRRNRVSQKITTLRAIRKSQDCVKLCIKKAPFQRVIRTICENWGLEYRWKRVALLCMQDAAEDFLVEYFCDLFILAAHTHRMTIKVQDSESLKRLRWKYDKLLHPADFIDLKMRDILLIPPVRKPKENLNIRDVTHNVNTRARAEYEDFQRLRRQGEDRKDTKGKKEDEEAKREAEFRSEIAKLDAHNQRVLSEIHGPVWVFINLADSERQLSLDVIDLDILRNPRAQISDSIIYVCMK